MQAAFHHRILAGTGAAGFLLLIIIAWMTPCAVRAQSFGDTGTVVVRPLGSGINTGSNEYAPTLTADGKTLYFVSDRLDGYGGHDFWVATRANRNDTAFSAPRNVGPPINTSANEGAGSISADGQHLYFTGCNLPGGVGDCDLYVATMSHGVWTNIRNLTLVNSAYWESQPAVSSDGNKLYFVSNRPGGTGGPTDEADIYVSTRGVDGEWGAAVNLGAPINTPGKEQSPFLLPGGNVLYFASGGHGGLGGLDFFYSVKQDDSTWKEPVNLGAPINTPLDERFITLPASGDVVCFASTRKDLGNKGQLDLFMAQLPPRSVTVLVQGRVFDAQTNMGLGATLVFVDSATGATLFTTTSNSQTGEYSVVTSAGKASTMQVYGTSAGYPPLSGAIAIPDANQYTEIRHDFPLTATSSGVALAAKGGAAARMLRAFPNPASKTVTIDCSKLGTSARPRELVVVGTAGEEVLRTTFSGDHYDMDVSALPSGAYVARIADAMVRFLVFRER